MATSENLVMTPKTITLALTGASGMPYGIRLLECLIAAEVNVYLLCSQAAQVVAKQEMDLTLPARKAELETLFIEQFKAKPGQLKAFGREEWFAPVASGSNPADAMVICPCSMGTVASIAMGLSDNLIERAADVMIKEKRQLILVPRETPFSPLHLENMLKLAQMNVTILPPNPGFYNHPKSIEDLIDFVVSRILDQLNIANDLMPRWGHNN